MDQPSFSIVVPVYNRDIFIKRCIESCINQTFTDFEVIVVDDGSTDNTAKILDQIRDPRLRIIKHTQNRGICPARNTGIKNTRGKWIVCADSDWTLFPDCLQRLYDLTNSIDESIIVIRARQVWDTGRVAPSFVPKEPVDYVGRIKYVDIEGGSDVLPCYRREVFEKVIFDPDRRGGLEYLYNLNMAQQGLTLYIEDILCKQYSDAPNSTTRGNMSFRVKTLKINAPDMLWMYQETMRLHGDALRNYGPQQYLALYRNIALQNFYMGKRWEGVKSMLHYLCKRPFDLVVWIIMVLGLIGPKAVLYGNAFRHLLRRNIQNYVNI
jgi:glycosyltransferase involved in cell wall biosynthesis